VTVDASRRAAYEVVHAVTTRDAYANLLLSAVLQEHALAGRDAAFATELAYGTLRRQGALDLVLARCSKRAFERIDDDLTDVLRLGAYQLLHTRVPAHAAVSTTVDLAGAVCRRGKASAGFVNAVLRCVSRRSWQEWVDEVAPQEKEDPLGHLAVRLAHPRWIAEAFATVLGEDPDSGFGETARAMAADNAPAAVTLVARPGLVERDVLATEAGGTPGALSPLAVRISGDPVRLAAVRDRRAGVQDEGSQLVTLALANAPLDGSDSRWLDMCAGPGGKAALLGSLAAQRGSSVLALERASHRARLVRRATAGLPVEVRTADATRPTHEAAFDRVLLDAPCTGLGALRRRPEARWRRQPEDLDALTALQARLLARALQEVRPGGLVAYVTCSPHRDETVALVDALLSDCPVPVEQVDARPLLPGLPAIGGGPHVQLWPHRHDTDGMFLALLQHGS
jgi:16S rRNA (cytosine967-C5)-methyltransferase